MDYESEVINRQMEDTRSALQDKLETLEQQVKDTVQGATDAVNDTVETVKDAVQETVGTVKDTVQDTVQSVKSSLDIAQHVRDHPWPMFVGAATVGFLASRWLGARGRATSRVELPLPVPHSGLAGPVLQAPLQAPKENWLTTHYREELGKLKGLALGVVGGLVREMLTSSAAPALSDQIKDVVDSLTVKMGGRLIEGPILPASTFHKPDQHEEGDELPRPAKMDWPMEASRS